MSIPSQKIEVGFDTTFSANANFFTLDNATKGQLDNTSYPLAGLQFVNVTSRVKDFSISRGRKNSFDAFPTGQAVVAFNNHDRAFDPLYALSPYVGNIVPRREIRITSGTVVQFSGWIDDWNLSYLPNGDSIAEAIAYDAISIISGQTLSLGTPTEQLTGARVNQILDDINWSDELRSIDTGVATVSDYPIDDNTNVMAYLQQVASSEPGLLFVGKQGKVNFIDRTATPTSNSLLYLGGTGIPFQNLEVVYGAENLYNEITLARLGGGTVTVTDAQSVIDYGHRDYSNTNLLLSSDGQTVDIAVEYAQRFSQPAYRFESLEVALHKLELAEQASVLDAELGSIAKVVFTPNGIGDAIERYVQIISIKHNVTPERHYIDFGFQSIDNAFLVLDDTEFGKLDTYSLSW